MASVLALGGDEITFSSLQEILATFGHTVRTASTGAQALAALRTGPCDLVLLDILQEGLEPAGLTRAIQDIRPGIRVVALTAYPREPLALEVLAAGAHSLMKKPYEIRRILELLEAVPS